MTKHTCIRLGFITAKTIQFAMIVALSGCGSADDQFPGYQQGIHFFEDNHSNLERVVQYFAICPQLEEISLFAVGSWDTYSGEGSCQKRVDQEARQVMEQIGIGLVLKTHDGSILFDAGAYSDSVRSWTVSFVYSPDEAVDHYECGAKGIEDAIGVCDFEISSSWSLRYEWHPVNFMK